MRGISDKRVQCAAYRATGHVGHELSKRARPVPVQDYTTKERATKQSSRNGIATICDEIVRMYIFVYTNRHKFRATISPSNCFGKTQVLFEQSDCFVSVVLHLFEREHTES